jgi:hypothetical protein
VKELVEVMLHHMKSENHVVGTVSGVWSWVHSPSFEEIVIFKIERKK